MSANVIFITEQVLKDRTGISAAIDGKQLKPIIKLAQDIFLRPALGSALYSRLQAGVTANSLTTPERTLLDVYVTDCLVWSTISNLPVATSYQFYAKGVLQKTADDSQTPSSNDLDKVTQHYQNYAEFYKQELINYLRQNYTSFSQYANPGCGWDVVKPVTGGYDCPIFLPDEPNCQVQPTCSPAPAVSTYPAIATYTATGNEASFELEEIDGKTILLATRAGLGREITEEVTADTNYLQVIGSTVTLPTGDRALNGEKFKFLYT